MKIKGLIEDELIQEVIEASGAKNITEALKIALKDYLSRRKLAELAKDITTEPIEFYYGEDQLRESNQR
jgi:Arc/MetJ family transcription regulator